MELRVAPSLVLAVVKRLSRFGEVAYAEPDYRMRASALAPPNDPAFERQWGDANTGQTIPTLNVQSEMEEGAPVAGTPGADDGALKAWGVSTGSPSIVIGETDTGVDYEHPDLASNVWGNPGGVGGCPAGTHGYNVLNHSCNPKDDDTIYGGHGTHVAGVMGAVGNNGIGVAGMNWQTAILPVKWLNSSSEGSTSGLIEALQWLVAAKQAGVNVRVVNDSATFPGDVYSQALSNEIEALGANGILFVTAAGNTGQNNDDESVRRYPCGYDRPTEICVTASNNLDQLPSWANYGPHTVDLAAPGVSIYSTLRGEGKYGYLSGGSTASPQVAGAAALILSVLPSLSAAELKARILNNVDKLPGLEGRLITGGRLDVCKALPGCPVQPPPPPVATQPPVQQVLSSSAGPAPVISRLAISPRAFTPTGRARTKGARGTSAGAKVSYNDSAPALAKLTIQALRTGVLSHRHCVAPVHGKSMDRSRHCSRYVTVARIVHHDRVGRNHFPFSGHFGSRELTRGYYRLLAVPAFEGHSGIAAVATFRIIH
jgi:subtilisin family serine protease